MRIVILGAGITGLTLAWKLRQRYGEKIDLLIYDKAQRAGGWMQTIEKEGFLFELGPRSCRPYGHGIETLRLIQELGLEDQVIHAAPVARRRYLFDEGQLHSLPASMWEAMTSPWFWQFIPSLCCEPWQKKCFEVDESIEQFFLRRLGPKVTYRLVDALISGIYAGDISTLSMAASFPRWHEWEKNSGSLLRGALRHRTKKVEDPFIKKVQKGGIFSLREGMGSLVQALVRKLDDVLQLRKEVMKLVPEGDKIRVVTSDGREELADHVFSTLPQGGLNLLEGMQEFWIKNTSTVVVSLGYRSDVLQKEGFGYLVPQRENQKILGVVWDSSVFPQQNQHPEETRLTVMLGGEHHLELADTDENEIVKIALEAVSSHMGIQQLPDVIHVHRALKAIPQYLVGHLEKIKEMRDAVKKKTDRLTVLGTSFDGISVNDAIASAAKAVLVI